MGKNERVTTDVLDKVCVALNCDVGDIMGIIIEEDPSNCELGDENNE